MLVILIPFCGFYADVHYCNSSIKSVGLFTDAESCNMDSDVNTICITSNIHHTIKEKECCSQSHFFSKLNLTKLSNINYSPLHYIVIRVSEIPRLSIENNLTKNLNLYRKKEPLQCLSPNLLKNQVFII